jgi:hypothetical protein
LVTHLERPPISSSTFLARGCLRCTPTLRATAVDANLDAREITQALHCVVQAAALARDDEQIPSLA